MINSLVIESAFAEFGNQASSKVITFKRYVVGLTLLLWSCGMVVYRKGVSNSPGMIFCYHTGGLNMWCCL